MKKEVERRIIAFDMDGTLLTHKKKISFLTLHYLRKLTKQGHLIVLASGRPSRSLKKYYNHEFVKHRAGEYNRDKKDKDGRTAYKINTNSIEGFWSQLKRGINGIYHWASKKHIQRYINEFCYRYNNRLMNDIEIFANWFGGCENKRVYYKCLVG